MDSAVCGVALEGVSGLKTIFNIISNLDIVCPLILQIINENQSKNHNMLAKEDA